MKHRPPFARTMRTFVAAAALAAAVGFQVQPAMAQDAAAPAPNDAEALPTSRAILAAVAALNQGGVDEPTLRSASGLQARSQFMLAGTPVALSGSGDARIPRRALGPDGQGVTILIKLPALSVGIAAPHPDQDATFALALVKGTRISVYALYPQVPSDGVLGRRMLAAMTRLETPLFTFDPTFKPGPEAGAAAYLLK